ncbi:MAG: HNH endonuclease [Bacteroidales bacterium]|nr:HNH endonuclease [Bacteroidales bacterium]
MGKFTPNRIQQVWDKGIEIKGKNPNLYREDKFGNQMYRYSYGKYSEQGWNIDHSKPQAQGGTDHLNNLQPMNSRANCKKGDKY